MSIITIINSSSSSSGSSCNAITITITIIIAHITNSNPINITIIIVIIITIITIVIITIIIIIITTGWFQRWFKRNVTQITYYIYCHRVECSKDEGLNNKSTDLNIYYNKFEIADKSRQTEIYLSRLDMIR